MSTQSSAIRADLPPSVPAGSHEMRDYYPGQDPPRPSPHTAPSITPYLGLRARLSQIWINRWTILLLLVLARTLIAISGINSDLASARREAHSACSGVESMGSAMASLPHYMSQGANELAAKGVEKAVNGLMEMTLLSVTGVEEIVVYVVDTMTSTYTCLITMAVDGTIDGAINVIEESQSFLNSSIKLISKDISDAESTFTSDFDKAVSSVQSVLSTFGKQVTFPTLNLTHQLAELDNIKLPTNRTPILNQIKANLPTFQQVQNDMDTVLKTPFEFVKSEIQSYSGNYTFDRSVFPVPAKEELTFCSDNNDINDFFDELVHIAAVAKSIFIGVIVGAAILVCFPMAWREIKRWRTTQERSKFVQANAHDPMDVVYIVSRPYTSTAGIKAASVFQRNRKQILTRWVFAYATSDAALFVLSLALAGLFSVSCQAILLKILEREVPSLTNEVSAFADKVIAQLNNASKSWAVGANSAISAEGNNINTQLLSWVNTTTTAVNDTLNVFVDDTTTILNQTFGGTVLYTPILDVLKCLVLLKVTGIEKALTWVSDNAHVDFPTLPSNIFSVGAIASIASNSSSSSDSFLSLSGDQASDQISSAVSRFVTKLQDTIHTEAVVAAVILGVYLMIILIAIIRALILWGGREKTRGEGGPAPPPDDFRSGQKVDPDENIAMEAVYTRPLTPAPKYSSTVIETNVRNPFTSPEDDFNDSKIGFAGHREYDHTVSRNPTGNGKERITSVHPEVYGDFKS